jgi:hypothetical protein
MLWWPQINNGNLVVKTMDKYDDSPANSIDKLE